MGITHVIRAEEWLPSTPKHILLYRAFGWDTPTFAHLPLLLSTDKKKLSKRMGDVAVEDYIKKGYLKEAIINFVALLGWNPGEGSTQEIFTLAELIEKFDLKHVHKAGAVFDLKKLDWLNAQYIKKLSIDELYKISLPYWQQKDFFQNASEDMKLENYLKKILSIEQERLENLSAVGESNKFFFQDIEYNKDLLRWKDMTDEKLKISLESSYNYLSKVPEEKFNHTGSGPFESELFTGINQVMEEQHMTTGELLWPLRAALTGEQKSPSPFEVAWVLGKTESLIRLKKALDKL
jgi:glutamyl/glutaminyl-tRNA synthetase